MKPIYFAPFLVVLSIAAWWYYATVYIVNITLFTLLVVASCISISFGVGYWMKGIEIPDSN